MFSRMSIQRNRVTAFNVYFILDIRLPFGGTIELSYAAEDMRASNKSVLA